MVTVEYRDGATYGTARGCKQIFQVEVGTQIALCDTMGEGTEGALGSGGLQYDFPVAGWVIFPNPPDGFPKPYVWAAEDVITILADTQIQPYAVAPARGSIYLTYAVNGGIITEGFPVYDGVTYSSGNSIVIPDYTPIRPGYTFTLWNTMRDGTGTSYSPGDTITPVTESATSNSYTLFAQWV